jgi:pyruvate dehydrogenase E2 component (dihydrolipoamide acetyltransferase)
MTGRLVDVTMPRLSDSMEEATILRWLKQPGDAVSKGEPLVEVETDKATIVYEAETAGVLSEISVGESESAALGAVIARLAIDGGNAGPAAPARPSAPQSRPRATPVARRLAGELGVALGTIDGSGPGGRIVEADVRRAVTSAPEPRPATTAAEPGGRGEETVVELTPTQRTIAERMTASRSQIPEFTLQVEVDMERAVDLRDDLRELGRSPLPSVNDLLVRAAALALREFPAVNAGFVDGRASASAGSTSASPWPPTTRCSCRRSSTPTASPSSRSPRRPASWSKRPGRGRSGSTTCATARSRSRTSACSGSGASRP